MTALHVYVHVPFCARRCTYCDFSIAVRKTTPIREYLAALEAEARMVGVPAEPKTIYLGGGTPSRLGGEGITHLANIVHTTHDSRRTTHDVEEFTIEANPDDVTPEAARAWREAGVNRLSLGAQSFHEPTLQWMHRTHDAAAIERAVQGARGQGLGNISLDLIFALPESLKRNWRRDLEQAIALEPDHISLYGLTVDAFTPLARQIERGAVSAAPDSRWEEEYLLAHELLEGAGFHMYEVSNAARPGREAVHNRAYWTRAPYLGLGPSAHSFDGTSRWWNEPAYAKWRAALAAGHSPVAGREILNPEQRRLEDLYLGLRTAEGVALDDRLRTVSAGWVRSGWAEGPGAVGWGPGARLRLTPLGWLRIDALVASL